MFLRVFVVYLLYYDNKRASSRGVDKALRNKGV